MWGFLLKGAFHMKQFGCILILIGLFVYVYLMVSTGTLTQLQHAKSFSTVPLPNVGGLTLSRPSASSSGTGPRLKLLCPSTPFPRTETMFQAILPRSSSLWMPGNMGRCDHGGLPHPLRAPVQARSSLPWLHQ